MGEQVFPRGLCELLGIVQAGLLVQVLALAALILAGLLTYLVAGALAGALKPRTLLKEVLGR